MSKLQIKQALIQAEGNISKAAEIVASGRRCSQEPVSDEDDKTQKIIDEVISGKLEDAVDTYGEDVVVEAIQPETGDPEYMESMKEYLLDDPQLAKKYLKVYGLKWGWLNWLQANLVGYSFCFFNMRGPERVPLIELGLNTKTSKAARTKGPTVRRYLKVEKDFYAIMRDCEKSNPRFIVGLFGLPGHSNALIFDYGSNPKRIIRFEPHGGAGTAKFPPADVDKAIKDHFLNPQTIKLYGGKEGTKISDEDKKMFKGWTYVSPTEFCPLKGPQSKQAPDKDKGYCVAWSMLFLHRRITNPDLTEAQIVDDLLAGTEEELLDLIRGYAAFVATTVKVDRPALDQSWIGRVFNVDDRITKRFIGNGVVTKAGGERYTLLMNQRGLKNLNLLKSFDPNTNRAKVSPSLMREMSEYQSKEILKDLKSKRFKVGEYANFYWTSKGEKNTERLRGEILSASEYDYTIRTPGTKIVPFQNVY